jgi:hypothetical protein
MADIWTLNLFSYTVYSYKSDDKIAAVLYLIKTEISQQKS